MYRTEGIPAGSVRNFLALLGWSPGGDEEFIRTKDLIEKFSLAGVSRTNAVFDRPKLENGQHAIFAKIAYRRNCSPKWKTN